MDDDYYGFSLSDELAQLPGYGDDNLIPGLKWRDLYTMSTEDEFGTCNVCGEDDWLTVDEGDWLCSDCAAIRIIQNERMQAAEEYRRVEDEY